MDIEEYRSCVFSQAPALGRLLDSLDAGIIPGWLEVMAALSQGVAFLTDFDSVDDLQQACGNTSAARYCPLC